jgi:DNA-binding MarR family transcriptional regulator
VSKPLCLPFDPITRADDLWARRWGSVPAMTAITSIMRAHQILLSRVDAVVKPYGLTFARYEALVLLTFSRTGELSLSKIGERLMVHPTSVTNTVDRLERAGLVSRRPNPMDGRGVLAAITDQGRRVVENATRDLMAMEFGLETYGPEACREIFEVLRPLRVAAGDFAEPETEYQPEPEPETEHKPEGRPESAGGAAEGLERAATP